MFRNVATRWLALAHVLAVFASCDTDRPISPDRAVPPEAFAPHATTVSDGQGNEYTLLEERIPDHVDVLSLTQLIGLGGGQVSLAGHRLVVPPGAVEVPTLFTMTLVPNGYIEVKLTAVIEKVTSLGLLRRILRTNYLDRFTSFTQPVRLELNYARATNIDVDDPGELVILRLHGDDYASGFDVMETSVDAPGKRVVAELSNFSRYCVAQGRNAPSDQPE